jgi:hypothetical protein
MDRSSNSQRKAWARLSTLTSFVSRICFARARRSDSESFNGLIVIPPVLDFTRVRARSVKKIMPTYLAVCSSYILAEKLGYAVSFSSPWCGKHRVFEWRKPVIMDQLQPSTNADKLSDSEYKMGVPNTPLQQNAQHRHFSVTRDSLRSRRVWSTEAVRDASPLFQSLGLLPPPVLVLHRCYGCVRAEGASKPKRGRWRGRHLDCHAGCACVDPLP